VSGNLYALRRRRYKLVAAVIAAGCLLTFAYPLLGLPVVLVGLPRFRLWLYRLAIHSATCPTCGTVLPLVGSWRCGGCGFVQHRHVYAPCGKCRAAIPEVPCPRCEHGVFL